MDFDRFRDHSRITLLGTVADMSPLGNSHRLFVAPTRYATGLPYKAMRRLPMACQSWRQTCYAGSSRGQDGENLLAADLADPAAFARQVLALYRSEELWNRSTSRCGRADFYGVQA